MFVRVWKIKTVVVLALVMYSQKMNAEVFFSTVKLCISMQHYLYVGKCIKSNIFGLKMRSLREAC